jgi:hypothetical protein
MYHLTLVEKIQRKNRSNSKIYSPVIFILKQGTGEFVLEKI